MAPSLCQFPPDLLAQMLSYVSGSDLVELWKCGNTNLSSKITSSVSRVSLDETETLAAPPIPAMVFQLKSLRQFSLKCLQTRLPSVGSSILRLPKTLESLTVTCGYQDEFFNQDESGELCHPLTVYNNIPSRLIDLASRFSGLIELHVGDTAVWLPSDLVALPPTLTRLAASKILIDYPQLEITKFLALGLLPRGLLRLETTLSFELGDPTSKAFLKDWSLAPPHLDYISAVEGLGDFKNYDWLPKSLRKWSVTLFDDWTVKLARSLPPLLEELELNVYEADSSFEKKKTDVVRELPKQLKSLSSQYKLPASSIESLPKTLTKLELCWNDTFWLDLRSRMEKLGGGSLNEKSFSIWPPSLRHLRLMSCGISAKDLNLLPKTLTFLNASIGGLADPPKSSYQITLSPVLQDLDLLLCLNSQASVTFSMLPRSLTRASFDLKGRDDRSVSFPKIDDFALPSLTSLTLPIAFEVPSPPEPKLGAMLALKVLVLARWHLPEWSFSILPRTLTYLVVDDLRLKVAQAGAEGPRPFEGLPSSMASLAIHTVTHAPMQTLSPLSFASFPLLEYLDVSVLIMRFPSATLRSLPRKLRYLSLRLIDLADEDAPFIPRYLEKLNFELDTQVLLSRPEVEKYWPYRYQPTA